MTEKFEIKGEWFLPTNRENRVYGILNFDPNDGVDIELYGSLEGDDFSPEFKDQPIILGLTSDSKQVTLCNSFMTKSGGATLVSGEESGKPSTKYSVKYLLIGTHSNTIDDLKFNKISTEVFNLGEWVGISGFSNKREIAKIKNNEVVVEYKLPETIEFVIDNKTSGKFVFYANSPGLSRYQKSISITQRVEFQAISSDNKSIDELLKMTITFQNFLTLALYKSTFPLSISLSGENHKKEYGDGQIINKSIKLFFSSRNLKVNEKPKFDMEMMFDYRRIKDDFPKIIKNWYSKYELLEPAFDLVFEQFYNGNKFSVNTFLNLAQAAETFHSRIDNHTKIPRDEYKKMKEEILSVAPVEYHSWLNEQFAFGNHLNLHRRLTEITTKYSNDILDKILGDKNQFVLDVKNSRNYYTHYSKDGKKKSLEGGKLFYLSERLKVLLVCSFLTESGFDKAKLSIFLDNIKWKNFNHLADWKTD